MPTKKPTIKAKQRQSTATSTLLTEQLPTALVTGQLSTTSATEKLPTDGVMESGKFDLYMYNPCK